MKYLILLTTVISAPVFAMEQAIQIRDRNLATAQKPHITIINLLPKDNPLFSTTRIDISDKTSYGNSYRPNDSTATIYSNQGIRFSPRFNKIGEPEHTGFGMNETNDAAYITLYIYADKESPFYNLIIGKGSKVRFGDTLIFTAEADGKIILKHNNEYRIPQAIVEMDTLKFIGLDYGDKDIDEEFLKNNPYIAGIVAGEGQYLAISMLVNLFNAMGIKNSDTVVHMLLTTGKTDELECMEESANIQDILDNMKDIFEFMVPDSDFYDSDEK